METLGEEQRALGGQLLLKVYWVVALVDLRDEVFQLGRVEGRLAREQLVADDADCPDVHLVRVAGLPQQLG